MRDIKLILGIVILMMIVQLAQAQNPKTTSVAFSQTADNHTNRKKRTNSLDIDISNRLYPKITVPTRELVVVDLHYDSLDAQVAACVLQGIVNRSSTKKIYVTNTYCADNGGAWNNVRIPGYGRQAQMAENWLREVFPNTPKEILPLDPKMNNPGLMAVLTKFKSFVKGLIIYDPLLEKGTIEAATTIAGQTDGLVVSPAFALELKEFYFPVLKDLRELQFKNNISCLQWLKANYFEKANKQVAFTWSHMSTDRRSWGAANKDYVVANRLFTFYLNNEDKEERRQYSTIIKEYPAGTPVMGWADERFADALFASYGYFMVPFISVENLSVMSSYPSVSGKKPEPKVYPINNNSVYIAFQVADGDNLEHSLMYQPFTILNSANFGKVPLTWIMNPGIVDLAPLSYNWFISKFSNTNQEMGAMMGDGSPQSDRYSGFSFYCDFANHYINQAGILTMKQMAEGEAVSWRVQPYVLISGYAGTDSRGIGPYEYHMDGESFHIGSVHISEHNIKNIIQSAPANKPLFLSIFAGTASGDIPSGVKKFCDELLAQKDGRQYYFIRSMDLTATYRAWKGLPAQ